MFRSFLFIILFYVSSSARFWNSSFFANDANFCSALALECNKYGFELSFFETSDISNIFKNDKYFISIIIIDLSQNEDEALQLGEKARINSTFPLFGVVDVLNTTDLQSTLWPSGNTRYEGCIVTVSGIVTADTAQYNSSYSSYALSEGFPGQWSGLVFDTEEMVDVTRGDHVTVTGLVTDYDPDWPFQLYGNTRLINAEVTVDSQVEVPAPTLVTCAELAQTADEVESYEGVLVSLNDVTISSVNSYDWSITDETGFEALIDDDMLNFRDSLLMDNLVEGQQLSHVMGIFNYSFGTYKVQIRDAADLGQMVGVDDDVKVNPYEYALHDNFPNPFNPETQIRFSLGGQEDVKLMIYDITGRQVRTLVNGNTHDAGFHVVHWNGLDNSGQKVPSGMYIYRIKAGNFIADKKMLLVK